MKMNFARLLRHLLTPPWLAMRRIPPELRAAIAAAVAAAESGHCGELRVAIEGPLPWRYLRRDLTPRERALELFGELRVWDTENNSGVLIYLQLVDRDVEVLADRGIAAKVSAAEWTTVCRDIETAMAADDCRGGLLAAIERTGRLLAERLPADPTNPNEMSDAPWLR